jgi:hypothetical protein
VNTFGDGFGEADGWWDGGRSIEIESQGLSFDRAEKHRKRTHLLFYGTKVNPLCFRLGVTQRHRSHWFAKKLKYSYLLMEDQFIRKMISDQFPKAGILSISISRRGEKLDVELVATQPRVLRYMEVQI